LTWSFNHLVRDKRARSSRRRLGKNLNRGRGGELLNLFNEGLSIFVVGAYGEYFPQCAEAPDHTLDPLTGMQGENPAE
jgi:hypothetical protein